MSWRGMSMGEVKRVVRRGYFWGARQVMELDGSLNKGVFHF